MDLSASISDLLRSVQPGSDEPRKSAVDSVGRIGDASRFILSCIGSDTDEHFQVCLLVSRKILRSFVQQLMLRPPSLEPVLPA